MSREMGHRGHKIMIRALTAKCISLLDLMNLKHSIASKPKARQMGTKVHERICVADKLVGMMVHGPKKTNATRKALARKMEEASYNVPHLLPHHSLVVHHKLLTL